MLARLACVALALAGCADDADPTPLDTQASEHVAAAVVSTAELARLVQPLEASPDLMTTPDAPTQIAAADTAFRALVANPGLCLTITTTSSTIRAVFRNCLVALVFRLNGELNASVVVANNTVESTVSTLGLTLSSTAGSSTLAGTFVLRQPIPTGSAPVEFEGDVEFSNSAGGELTLLLAAQWTVTRVGERSCVDLTGGAELSGNILGELSPISLAGDGVRVCRNECPSAGHVELSYGRGELLVWDYDGTDTTTVIGPRGKTLDVALSCGLRDNGEGGGSD